MKSIQNVRTGKIIAVVDVTGGIKRAEKLIKSGIYVSDNSPLPVSKEVAITVVNEAIERVTKKEQELNEKQEKLTKIVQDEQPTRTKRGRKQKSNS